MRRIQSGLGRIQSDLGRIQLGLGRIQSDWGRIQLGLRVKNAIGAVDIFNGMGVLKKSNAGIEKGQWGALKKSGGGIV